MWSAWRHRAAGELSWSHKRRFKAAWKDKEGIMSEPHIKMERDYV